MSLSKLVLLTIAASFLGFAAYADSAPPAAPPAMGAMGGHGMMRGLFTPEERMMLFADMHMATANMTDDQKHAYRDQRRASILVMSEADRTKFKADLNTRWNALPADRKAVLTARMQAFMAARRAGATTQ